MHKSSSASSLAEYSDEGYRQSFTFSKNRIKGQTSLVAQQADISITSNDHNNILDLAPSENGFRCFVSPFNFFKEENLYTDLFPCYPHLLVTCLKQFFVSDPRHFLVKYLNYLINYAFYYCQTAYQLMKLISLSKGQVKSVVFSFEIFCFFLNYAAISKLCRVKQILKALSIDSKLTFQNLQSNFNIQTIIRDFLLDLIKKENHAKFQFQKKQKILQLIDIHIGQILSKNKELKISANMFQCIEINLITTVLPIQKSRKMVEKFKYKFSQDLERQLSYKTNYQQIEKQVKQCSGPFYKKIYCMLGMPISKDQNIERTIYSTLLFLTLIKIGKSELVLKVIKKCNQEVKKVRRMSMILKFQTHQDYLIRSNLEFRKSLPKLHLVLKNNGFSKICVFLNQASIKQIQDQIKWCVNANVNLRSQV